MPFSLTDILYGVAAPVAVACAAFLLVRGFFPGELSERYAASIAVLAGFVAGFGLLGLGPWIPTAHWQWLPHAMLCAGIAGPVSTATDVRWWERTLLYAMVAAVAAWFLVPTWDDQTPSRFIHAVAVVAYVSGLASVLEPLARRQPGPLLPAMLWLTMTAAAVVLALSGSLRFAQIALSGAASLFGILLIAGFQRDANNVKGLGLVFSVLAVGSLSIGRVNSFSEVPLLAYMLVPVAPVLLWAGTAGPLARLTGAKRWFVCASLPIAVLAGAVLLAGIADLRGGGGEF